jgi:hypothetical protein
MISKGKSGTQKKNTKMKDHSDLIKQYTPISSPSKNQIQTQVQIFLP